MIYRAEVTDLLFCCWLKLCGFWQLITRVPKQVIDLVKMRLQRNVCDGHHYQPDGANHVWRTCTTTKQITLETGLVVQATDVNLLAELDFCHRIRIRC